MRDKRGVNVIIYDIRHAWPEKAGFLLSRPKGDESIVFLHFHNSVEILVGGRKIITRPNACIFYGVHTPHWFRSEELLIHDWMHLSPDCYEIIKEYGLDTDRIFYPADCKIITDIVRELEAEHFSPKESSDKLADCKLNELFIKLSRSVDLKESPVERNEYLKMRVARRELVLDCHEQWSVSKIAAKVGLSPSRFHTIYKKLFGTTPIDDVIRARIRKAQLLLQNTDSTAKEISEICGYENETHFNRQFKKHTGTTPGRYRTSNK